MRAFLHRFGLHFYVTVVDTGFSERQECRLCPKRRILANLFSFPTIEDIRGDLDWKDHRGS